MSTPLPGDWRAAPALSASGAPPERGSGSPAETAGGALPDTDTTAISPTAAEAVPPAAAPTTSTRRALVFVYVGYLFRYAYLLVLIPFYGRVLGAEEYGRLLAAMSLYLVVWMLTEYGFPIVGARDAAATRSRADLARLFGRHTMGRLAMLLPGLAVGLGGTLLSPVLRESPLLGVLATLAGVVAAFNLGWFFQGTLRFTTSVALEVCGFAINLPLILWLVDGPGDAPIAMAVLLGSSIVCTLAALVIVLRSVERPALRWRGGFSLVRESTALFAHKGLTMLMASSSTYLLSLFGSAAQVGWYGVAERLATVGLSLMQPANHVLVGTVAQRISQKDSEDHAYRLMRSSLVVMSAFGLLMLVATLLLAEPLVPLILGPSFGPTVPMLQMLGVMFPFAAFCQVVSGYVLIPLRHDQLVSLISLFGAATTVLLILGLGLTWGGSGVAVARVMGYVAIAVALALVLHRKRLFERIWNA